MHLILSNLNNIGLVMDIAGALLMFFGTEKASYEVYIYNKGETERLEKKAYIKNLLIKTGALLLFFGFLLQIFGNNL